MKFNKNERVLISMFLEDYSEVMLGNLERLRELVAIYQLDPDNEYAPIDKGIHLLTEKLNTIKNPKSIEDLTKNVRLKKALEEAKKTGGVYGG